MSINICKLSDREVATLINALSFWKVAGRPQYPDCFENIPEGPIEEHEIEPLIQRLEVDVTFEAIAVIEDGIVSKVITPFDTDYMQIHVLDKDYTEGDLVSVPLPEGEGVGIIYTPDKVVSTQAIDSVPEIIKSFDEASSTGQCPETLSEEEFEERFLPKQMDNGDLYELDDLKRLGIKAEHVWTIVEGDSGDLYASAGYHVVNRLGYIVTEMPWVTGLEEAVWHQYTSDEDDDQDDSTPPSSMTANQASDLFATASL